MVLTMPDMTPQEVKDALKAGIREWLDERFVAVGKWTLRGLAALGLTAIAFLMIVSSGWGSK